jgi:acetate kinase
MKRRSLSEDTPRGPLVLVMNAGSSSVKLSAFVRERCERRSRADKPASDAALLKAMLETLKLRFPGREISAVGHRIVHGGDRLAEPVLVTPQIVSQLEALIPLAPLHQPQSLAGIQLVAALLPDVPQVVCFDTAFHQTMPLHERMLGLPRAYFERGVKRFGFHGLSYESVAQRLPELEPRAAEGRTVVCHLGSGASLCALRGGQSTATTMSFTPLDGLLMGTRAGALDPGVVLYLLRQEKQTLAQLEHLLASESGLLGVSGISADLRVLLASPASEAAEAVDLFCYRVVRELGAMVAALGGLDALVFTGGIGESSSEIRERVCGSLGWLGVALDPMANQAGQTRLHAPQSTVAVLCVPADEEAMIARHTRRLAATT